MRRMIFLVIFVGLTGVLVWVFGRELWERVDTPEAVKTEVIVLEEQEQERKLVDVVAEGLDIPWEIVFLPSGEMLVTQRSGSLLLVAEEKKIPVEGVVHRGEGGLLGMALDPNYENNNFLYLYLTGSDGGKLVNRVERYVFDGERLTGREVIVEGIIGASNHDGGRIAFGPDGYLYVTTGDAQQAGLAQNSNSLNGKILRVKTQTGEVEIYTLGHRNPQGLAWDGNGQLWATEHGPSGLSTGYDEINLIVKGNNYGWPTIKGDEESDGMEMPRIHSGKDTWAPSGLVYWQGSLFFTGLRGEALYGVSNLDGKLKLAEYFKGEFGRLREVVIRDDYLYVSTSNRDGRGKVNTGDDKIIKIDLRGL